MKSHRNEMLETPVPSDQSALGMHMNVKYSMYSRRGRGMHGSMRHAVVALASICALATAGSALAAGRVFYDGFESGNTNLWSQDDFRNRCQPVTAAADNVRGPHSGTYMLRCNWNGSAAWNDPASYETLRLTFSGANELFLRFWIRPDNNAKDHPANGPKIWRLAASNDMSFWALNFRTGIANGALYNSSNAQIGSTFWGGSNLSDGAWHKTEIYIKQGTSDGIVRYWEDGVKKYEAVNVNTTQTSKSWSPFYISSNWSGAAGCCDHDATNYLYWDDFEIYSDLGTGANGSLADATISASASSTSTLAGGRNLRVTGTAP